MIYNTKLKQLREENKLILKDISTILNIDRSVYGRYENGYEIIPIKHLNTLCNYFNVSLDYIFGLNYQKNYNQNRPEFDLALSSIRLKEFRKESKLTQAKLASILNTDNSTISKYEQKRNPISTPFLYTICSKYHISADYILGKIDEPKYL